MHLPPTPSTHTLTLYKPFDKLRKALRHDYMNKSIQGDSDYFIHHYLSPLGPLPPPPIPLHPVTSRIFGMII